MVLTRVPRFFLAALLAVATWMPATAADDAQPQVQEYLQACVDVEKFMGSVLVVNGDRELVARGCGFANVELRAPNTTKTKFRLGSITKQFTAMAIMLLAEQGKLAVDDPVRKHLEGTPDTWNDLTIHHLLSHTSGIPNFTSFPDYAATMMLPATPSQLISRFKDKPLEFAPGEKFAYSNSGYVVLGAVIEKASGKAYGQFLQDAIFEPLEMRDTGYDRHDQIIRGRAAGYEEREGTMINASFIDMSVPFAAGGLYSTVEDLWRWDKTLRSGKLVSAESLAKMRTPVKDDFGYGWKMETRCGRQLVTHGGGINGFSTYMIHIPEMRALVVVLSNVVSHRTGRMAYDLTSILLGGTYRLPRTRRAIELESSAYDGLVGVYWLSPSLRLTVSRDGEHLYSTVFDKSKDELFPEANSEFFYKSVDAQITFVRDHDGRANRLVLHQGGSDTVGIRIEAGAVEPRRSFFGAQISPLCGDLRKREQLGGTGGIVVDIVIPSSTAAEAGLEPGDVILSINGALVADVADFLVKVSDIEPGGAVEVDIVRDGCKATKRGAMKERLSK